MASARQRQRQISGRTSAPAPALASSGSAAAGPEAEPSPLLFRRWPRGGHQRLLEHLIAPQRVEQLLRVEELGGDDEELPLAALQLAQPPQGCQLAVRDAAQETHEHHGVGAGLLRLGGGVHLVWLLLLDLRGPVQQAHGVLPALRLALGHLHQANAEGGVAAVGVADVQLRLRVLYEKAELPLYLGPDGLALLVAQEADALHVGYGEQVLKTVGLDDPFLDLVQLLRPHAAVDQRVEAEQPHHLVEGLLVVKVVLYQVQGGLGRLGGDVVLKSESASVVLGLGRVLQLRGHVDVHLQLRARRLRGLELLYEICHLVGGLDVVLLGESLLDGPCFLLQQRPHLVQVQVPDLLEEGVVGRQPHRLALLLGPPRRVHLGDVVLDPERRIHERLVRELRAQHREQVHPAVNDDEFRDPGGAGDLGTLLPLRPWRHRRNPRLGGHTRRRSRLPGGLLLTESHNGVHDGLARDPDGVDGRHDAEHGLQVHQTLGGVEHAGGVALDVELAEHAGDLH
mmetsp:Transcript_48461/g.135099  ORF Transcript_48461/g.135099 Transcript_48461/m.135099 type:complete len:511 (+) Transcript_48461:2-1534(+)